MIERPVLRYPGGKFRIAEWVLSHFPPHRCYLEPFTGAASVFMRKPRAAAECINDRDDNIVNVFRVLQDRKAAKKLRRRLELTPYSRTEFEHSFTPPTNRVDAAYKTIVRAFMAQGPDAVTRGYRSGFRNSLRNRENSALASHEWANWPDQIPYFLDRLRGVSIENCDAHKIIERLDSPDTLIYADPPYPHGTRTAILSKHSYRHELTDDDHRRLAQTLHEVAGMVVISGYPCELYDAELYRDWLRLECQAKADRGGDRTEVLWLNPAAAEGQRQRRLIA